MDRERGAGQRRVRFARVTSDGVVVSFVRAFDGRPE